MDLETPDVVIDVERLQSNISTMARVTSAAGLRLRPHAKTHKVPQIARMQLDAGAVGLTVATVGEAEVFIEHGATDIFIAYPLWATPDMGRRLQAVAERASVTIGIDSAEGARNLARHLGSSAQAVAAWVEVDSGHHRSGLLPDSDELAAIAEGTGLRLTGVFTFPGHSYAPGHAQSAASDEGVAVSRVAAQLRAAGHDITHASGGSTPSAILSSSEHMTEVRPGVYALYDAQQLELGRCEWGDIALSIQATVVSRRTDTHQFIANAGSKVMGSDRATWATGCGRVLGSPDARVTALSEHHATVRWPDGQDLPDIGTQVRLIPNHVCLVMNLVDEVTVMRGGEVVDRWRVAARGRNK